MSQLAKSSRKHHKTNSMKLSAEITHNYIIHNSYISYNKFKQLFKIINVARDGNCLFHSMAILMPKYNHRQLRKMVSEYYKTFSLYNEDEYEADSLEFKLKIQAISDNEENENGENGEESDDILHEEIIGNDGVWCGVMDVIALAIILKINICLLVDVDIMYNIQYYNYNKKAKTCYIKYNGVNHFEPLYLI